MLATIILGVIGLGIMVFVHELGHFVAAKMNGVAVEVFSLGWGRKLVGFRRKGTLYQISWFPIGGYCKMKGEVTAGIAGGGKQADAQAASAQPAALPEKPAVEQPPGGSFTEAAPWRRIVIAAFGPLFNLVFAAIIFTVIWWAGFTVYSADNRVVLATDYTLDSFAQAPPAKVAGLKTGDRIVSIDRAAVEKFQDILEKVAVAPNHRFVFTVERTEAGATKTLEIPITPQLDKSTGAGKIGIYAWMDPVVASVQQGSAAAMAGLHKGDRIVQVDGRPVLNSMDLFQALTSKPSKVTVDFERDGTRMSTPLVLTYDEKGAPDLGIGFAENAYRSPRVGLAGALGHSIDETWNTAALTVKGFGLLFKGIKLRNAVAGPLRITYYIGSAASSGFQVGLGVGLVSFFRFLAFLSVVLFLMNLLPIPAMDGGQIVLFVAEIIKGKPVRATFFWRIQMVGFSLLILLSVAVTFSDILFFMGR